MTSRGRTRSRASSSHPGSLDADADERRYRRDSRDRRSSRSRDRRSSRSYDRRSSRSPTRRRRSRSPASSGRRASSPSALTTSNAVNVAVGKRKNLTQRHGRGLRKTAKLTGNIHHLLIDALAYAAEPIADPGFNSLSEELTDAESNLLADKRAGESLYEAYTIILQKGANDARSEDRGRTTRVTAEYINADLGKQVSLLRKFDHTPSTMVRRGDREVTGARSGTFPAAQESYCPRHDWEDESVRKQIQDGELDVAPDHYHRALYQNFEGDPAKVEGGFLKSDLLVQIWLAIFMAAHLNDGDENQPPAKKRRTGEDTSCATKQTVADILGFDGKVPPRTIAYAAALLIFALSNCLKWSTQFLGIDLDNLYNFIVDYLEDTVPGSKAAKRVESLLKWSNKQVYQSGGFGAAMHVSSAMSRDELRAQRLARENEPDSEDDE
ncbi:hypothetical protein MKEN_00276800 [Mycena kentingensis (nom. inval.)]|nr:hypothetical protein MKEN_00276800 [Mycena kentingensis (nom. inval.)]